MLTMCRDGWDGKHQDDNDAYAKDVCAKDGKDGKDVPAKDGKDVRAKDPQDGKDVYGKAGMDVWALWWYSKDGA